MLGTVTIYRPETQTNKLKLTLRNSSLLICHVCLSLPLKWEKWQNSDKNCKIVTLTSFVRLCYCFPIYTSGCLHEKTCTSASLIMGWLFDFISRLHDDWVIWCWWNTCVIQNRQHYACAIHSSLPADQFHTETGGCFAFTWYHCEFLYWSEILAPVQEPEWAHAGVTCTGITFCGGIM